MNYQRKNRKRPRQKQLLSELKEINKQLAEVLSEVKKLHGVFVQAARVRSLSLHQ